MKIRTRLTRKRRQCLKMSWQRDTLVLRQERGNQIVQAFIIILSKYHGTKLPALYVLQHKSCSSFPKTNGDTRQEAISSPAINWIIIFVLYSTVDCRKIILQLYNFTKINGLLYWFHIFVFLGLHLLTSFQTSVHCHLLVISGSISWQ